VLIEQGRIDIKGIRIFAGRTKRDTVTEYNKSRKGIMHFLVI